MGTPFEAVAYGKWILAGEHAVLRGSPALVFPLKTRSLRLRYVPGPHALKVHLSGDNGRELEPLFWAVLERACDLLKTPRAMLNGTIEIESSIPIGAGLGASAAFCVAMTRWFREIGLLRSADLYEFARTLENLFHGESSGVDIAVALSGEGLHFERGGPRFSLAPRWQPHWYISYTGRRGVTSEAVQKVKNLIENDPEKGRRLDEQMRAAAEDCERALAMEEGQGWPLLVSSVRRAAECFQAWGLCEGEVETHLRDLIRAGAVAVKPTGSGGGGYALSLWKDEPPAEWRERLISCN
ncbi:MAG: hypothetical protein KF865_06260 [Bdellovibrionaceae bacterium]|nr:hypothetical protein [Pseudobdellovibrionaceae bacterium]